MKPFEIINILALLVCILFEKKFNHPRFFSLFLFICIAFENGILKYFGDGKTNFPAINIYIILTVFYYQFVFLVELKSNKYYKQLRFLLPLCIILSLANYCFGQGMYHINSITYNFGLAVTSFFIFIYYRQLITEENTGGLFHKPSVWFSIGILMFYVSLFPFITFSAELIEAPEFKPLSAFLQIGNIILSGGYLATAIVMSKKKLSFI